MNKSCSSFDIDGVIFMGWNLGGVYPGPDDIIITGRSFEEMKETLDMLNEKGIKNIVYFNSLKYEAKTRESSGIHKANTINNLNGKGWNIQIAYEDDPIQAKIINELCPGIKIVLLQHDLVEKENCKHIKNK